MTKSPDDLEAIRRVLSALEPFEAAERQRILRYVLEKLAMPLTPLEFSTKNEPPPAPSSGTIKNLSTFVQEKNPKNDVQFAATVAYFHRFEAPADRRKMEINGDDLQDATRLAHRKRFSNPGQTLRNARTLGLLDNGSEEGLFAINSVGENLVAMTLPSGAPEKNKRRKPRKPSKRSVKK